MSGRIIAITGGPRSGKSTLVKLLAKHYGGVAFLEGEEKDFPQRIIEDMKSSSNVLELMLYFRNLAVEQYVQALKLKADGVDCFMDCFWLTNQPYIEAWVSDALEKEILLKLLKLDEEALGWPDKIIVLKNNRDGIMRFNQAGGRDFDSDNSFLERQLQVHQMHDSFFESIANKRQEVFMVDRQGLDFISNHDDFEKILTIISK